MTTLELAQLATVCGGMDEGQIRNLASQKCPRTFAKLAHKPMSSMTRADANACLNEWNPSGFVRGIAESQIDSYFASRRR